ncbi:hypothetical protein [Ruegeria arenilitoris]|uniref:hypothetical protein n=1 Tax=Ruegeria arenilitoris TaxID=1173585 RepID=UPI0014815056|nr:hypothetical protein [Ruegeria arenilitoris]
MNDLSAIHGLFPGLPNLLVGDFIMDSTQVLGRSSKRKACMCIGLARGKCQ